MKQFILIYLLSTILFINVFVMTIPQANAPLTGLNWITEISGVPFAPHHVGVDSQGRVFVTKVDTSPYQVWRSADQGISWTKVLESGSDAILYVYVDSRDYVYVYGAKIWRSVDNGATFTNVLNYAGISQLWHMDEDSQGRLYINTYDSASGKDYIFRSTDEGATFSVWHNITDVTHIHSIDVASNDFVFVVTGDQNTVPNSNSIRRWNGASWEILVASNDWEARATSMWFLGDYAYTGPDGATFGYRFPITGTWEQREKVFELKTITGLNLEVFWSQEVNDIAFFSSNQGQVLATWDGIHIVKIFDASNLNDMSLQQQKRFPFYFVNQNANKLYRISFLAKEDLVQLYYHVFNTDKGIVTNDINYVLEQRLYNGTEYIDLTKVALKNVQATIKGLSKINWAGRGNSGFEWNNKTNWIESVSGSTPTVTSVSDEVANGTCAYKVIKKSTDAFGTSLRPSADMTIRSGDYMVLSFYYKSNASFTNGITFEILNQTAGGVAKLYTSLTPNTSWQKYQKVLTFNATTTWTARYLVIFNKPTTQAYEICVDSHVLFVPEASWHESKPSKQDVIIYAPEHFNSTYFYADISTQNPSITITGQTISHSGTLTNGTSASPTSLSGIFTGAVAVTADIRGSGQAILRLSGTRVLYEDSIILRGRKDNVYYGRYFDAFSPLINSTDLIVATNLQANITWLSYVNDTLTLAIESALGTTSTTKVYVGDKGKPWRVSGASNWDYDPTLKVVTVTSVHSNPTITIHLDFGEFIDLNSLFLSSFDDYDAVLTRWMDINGTLVDIYESAQPKLSGIGYYLIGLIQVYNTTRNEYYLSKLRSIVDAVKNGSFFYKDVTFYKIPGINEIFYVPQNYYNNTEFDSSPKLTMIYAIASVYLYKWTGETSYKALADRVANETLKLKVVDNATDLAWSWGYYAGRTVSGAQTGVNRQAAITWFHILYGKEINSTFTTFVNRELNWQFRTQLASGGLAYSIGDTAVSNSYTGFHIAMLMMGYQIDPSAYSSFNTQLQDAINYMEAIPSAFNEWQGVAFLGALLNSWKAGFQVNINRLKALLYVELNQWKETEKGIAIQPKFSGTTWVNWRWTQYYIGMLYGAYPIPDGSMLNPDRLNVDYGGTINYMNLASKRIWVGNAELYGYLRNNNPLGIGIRMVAPEVAYPHYFLGGRQQGTPTSTVANGTYYIKTSHAYSDGSNITIWYYFAGLTIWQYSGSAKNFTWYRSGDLSTPIILTVSNGTTYNYDSLANGTKTLDSRLVLKENTTGNGKDTYFFFTGNSNSWYIKKDNTAREMTQSITQTNLTWLRLTVADYNTVQAFSNLNSTAYLANEPQPLSLNTVMNAYKNITATSHIYKYEEATWANTYRKPKNTEIKLLAISYPEKVILKDWTYNSNKHTIKLNGPSGTTSTTKIYLGNKGRPASVLGAASWDYNETTKISTILVTHTSTDNVTITLSWNPIGDINDDTTVNYADLILLNQAYSSTPASSNWNPQADLRKDDQIDVQDLLLLGKNYGKTSN